MATLQEILNRPGTRPSVIADAERIIQEEVDSKGLAGLPIKGAFKVVKAVKPGFVPDVIDALLDDFANALDPMVQAARADGAPVDTYMQKRSSEVAEALLGITDARSTRAKNQTVKSAYQKLRPMAKKHVEQAVPRVSKMIAKYTAQAEP